MQFTNRPEIDTALCDGCGRCLPVCPSGALQLEGQKVVLWQLDLCRWDSACELACPQGAIRVPYIVVFAAKTPGRA